jgi:hypothetical protein
VNAEALHLFKVAYLFCFLFFFAASDRFFAAAFDALVALVFRCSGVRALARATPPLRPIREK